MRMPCRPSRKLTPRRLGAAVLGAVLGLAGFQSTTNAATHTAVDSAGLTTLLNSSTVVLGDTIILNAATTYTAPSGGFILRAKSGTGYLTIQSSNLASLPTAGRRVFPSNASNMPNIVSPGANSPAIKTALPPEIAHHYKFIGIEVYNGGTQTELSNLIVLGDHTSLQNSPSVIANNIIFDRCYIHGQGMVPNSNQMRRAILLNSNSTDIINCYISDILSNAGQGACIGGWNGGGPYLIDNNYLASTGENIIFGGSSGTVVGQNPTGITVSRNHFYKDPAWKNVWVRPCNHFELKHGKNVIVRDNIFEYCWNNPADSQFGTSIGLKCVQGSGSAGSSWYVTEDILIENNRIHDVGLGFYIAGSVSPTGTKLYGQPKNITIRNNLAYNIDTSFTGNRGWLFYMQNSSPNVTIDHNTGFQTQMSMNSGDSDVMNNKYTGFVFTNNMTMKSQYGFSGGGSSDGELAFRDFYVSPTYQKNVSMGSSGSMYDNVINGVTVGPPWYAGWDQAPFNNAALHRPTSWTGVLQNQATPGADFSGFKVVGWDQPTNFATYPYNNSGTDGKDIGCDIDLLNTKTAGCISGIWSAPPQTKTLKNGLNGYIGNTSFHVRGQAPTTYYGSSRYYHEANNLLGTNGFVLRTFYKWDLSPTASGIPAGSTITDAKLRVKIELRSATTDYGIATYRVAPATGFTVNYAAATRNTYNGTNAWSGGANAGGEIGDSNNDYIDTPVANLSAIPAEGTWAEFNVTSAVQAWVSGTANNGFLVKPNSGAENNTVRISTPADSHGSAEYPELIVTYQ